MNGFMYYSPTRLLFGKDAVLGLPSVMEPYGKRVLLTYGGGSIKSNGLYEQILGLLEDFDVYELSGIEPNPKYSTSVVDGVRICKEKNIEMVLAVGGGSVLDCSKAIAAGACYDGETWDLITGKVPTEEALPLFTVLTLAATGSEFDSEGVISRTETNDKIGYMDDLLAPVCSILDPTLTFTVSPRQTAAGTADAMNHVMEQYFVKPATIMNDGFCESVLRSLMVNVKKALIDPEDYDTRAELMYACSLGCNGILSLGNGYSGWPCHGIEHALSGFYDIIHGEGLAIITPRWMEYILDENTLDRFVKFGTNVMDVDPSLAPMDIAKEGIHRLYRFFEELGLPMHLKDLGIDDSRIAEMAHHIAVNEGLDNKILFRPLSESDITAILTASL